MKQAAWYPKSMALRVAIFGQAEFGRLCLDRIVAQGYEIAGVFAPPESGRPDLLAARADELGLRLIRRRYYRKNVWADELLFEDRIKTVPASSAAFLEQLP